MPAVLMLVPFHPGMEGGGKFHSYEEAEAEHIPFVFPDSLPPASDSAPIRTDETDEKN